MEGVLVLVGLGLLAAAIIGPILAVVALVRTSTTDSGMAQLRQEVAALEARLAGLAREAKAARAGGAPAVVAGPVDASPAAAPRSPQVSPAAVAGVPIVQEMRVPAPALVSVPTAPRPELAPLPGQAPPPRPLIPPARPAAPVPPSRRPLPPHPSPSPSGPSFDWESLLGLRGAAWVGGVALVIAAALLAKWAFDQNIITPAMRIAMLLAMGTAALGFAELSLRRGYETTANAVSGAGIATLYIALFAGRSLYGLFPPAVAFAAMALVTVVACAVAIRYDAAFTAVLGLLGGFATPWLVSTGVDRPVALFSYIFLLNLGLLAVALHKRWHGLVLLALGATFLIEMGWFARYMSPEKAFIALGAFLLFGLLYLLLPIVGRTQSETVLGAGLVGGVAPFLFALMIAGQSRYVTEWPLLFFFIALLDTALLVVGLARRRADLAVSAGLATALFLPIWAAQNLKASGAVWGPTLAAMAIVAILNVAHLVACRWDPARAHDGPLERHAPGLLGGSGLGLFALILVAHGLGSRPWAFVALLTALVVVLVARTGERRVPGTMTVGALAVAALVQVWFFTATHGAFVLRNLSLPLLFPLVLSLCAARRVAARRTGASDTEDEAGVLVANAVALVGLFGCLTNAALGGDPWPLFLGLAVVTGLAVLSALRTGWSAIVPVALAASALFFSAWQLAHFQVADLPIAFVTYWAFFAAFVALPFLVPERDFSGAHGWSGLWIASALAGPLYFLPLYWAATATWGKGAIGLLPLALAAVGVLALDGVRRRFVLQPGAGLANRMRLRYLALFAAVALGFVALAIPLQLDRQWITIGWALEAMAVFWLFGRVAHDGLRAFGALLFAAVAVRLLMNPEVLHYQPRGLPLVNWLLYTYGVPALCCFLGARFLRSAEVQPQGAAAPASPWRPLAPAVGFLGLLLVFWLINLEIADFFSQGAYVELSWTRRHDRDLASSAAWGLYALALLVLGIWRRGRGLRHVGLGFLILTVGKVFLYDLSHLAGIHRVFSFFGLGLALVGVSLTYQRFVISKRGGR